MGKYIKALVAYGVIISLGFLQACYIDAVCPPPIYYYLSGVDIQAISWENSDGSSATVYTDTLKENLGFEITTEVEIIAMEQPNNNTSFFTSLGFINTAKANCTEESTVLNAIVPENSVLKVNKTISIGGLTITPDTNLLDIPEVQERVNFPTELNYENRITIKIETQEFDIPAGEYEFYFEWQTNDGIILSDNVTIFVDL